MERWGWAANRWSSHALGHLAALSFMLSEKQDNYARTPRLMLPKHSFGPTSVHGPNCFKCADLTECSPKHRDKAPKWAELQLIDLPANWENSERQCSSAAVQGSSAVQQCSAVQDPNKGRQLRRRPGRGSRVPTAPWDSELGTALTELWLCAAADTGRDWCRRVACAVELEKNLREV